LSIFILIKKKRIFLEKADILEANGKTR